VALSQHKRGEGADDRSVLPSGPLWARAKDRAETGQEVDGVATDPHALGQSAQELRTQADQPEVRVGGPRERERVGRLLIVTDLPVGVQCRVKQPRRTVVTHARTAELDGHGDRPAWLGAR
jgi:hypothetical protein